MAWDAERLGMTRGQGFGGDGWTAEAKGRTGRVLEGWKEIEESEARGLENTS